jgi:predicted DNA-binding transcriptional regulator AlpA
LPSGFSVLYNVVRSRLEAAINAVPIKPSASRENTANTAVVLLSEDRRGATLKLNGGSIKMVTVDEACGAFKTSASNNSSTGAPETTRRLLRKRELAAALGVSERTLDNWLAQKRIPRLRFSARLTRFSLPKVEAALARYEIKEVGARR